MAHADDDAPGDARPQLSPLARRRAAVERPHKLVPLPGPLGDVDPDAGEEGGVAALVALRDQDVQDARLAAITHLLTSRKLPDWMIETEFGQGILDAEVQVQLLWRALRVPKRLNEQFALSATDVRMNLEADERVALFKEYLAWQAERSPLKEATLDELEALLSDAKKDARSLQTSLSYYDSATLRSFITLLVGRLWKPTSES